MTSHNNHHNGPVMRLSIFTLSLLLLAAPLFRSGKVPLALMLLELLAVLGVVLYFWGGSKMQHLSRIEKWMLGLLLVFPLLQLIPLPGVSRLNLPGQADYYTSLQLVGEQGLVTLSILPRETLLGWLAMLVPVATFLLTRALSVHRIHILLALVFGMAAGQALLGLMQFGAGPDSVFMLGMEEAGGTTKGTWTGRNNYANFLNMSLMVSLALFFATLGRHQQTSGEQTLRERLVYLSSMQGHKAFLYGALTVLVLLAVVFSRSRAGIGLAMVGIVLAGLVFSRRVGGQNIYGMAGSVISVALALGVAIGLGPVWERFAEQDPLSDGRFTTFANVWDGIVQFFPLGTGSGTFEHTYLPFQDLSQAIFTINRAHNSYLEWLFTGGVIAGLLIVAFLALYIARWFVVWKKGPWGDFRYIQVGAGLAMALTLMHEMVDFNLFVPANMAYFGFFAGVFFHPYDEPAPKPKPRKRNTPRMDDERSRPLLQPVATEGARNPFMD